MPKSVITCDMEGIIETYNEGAREIFKYEPEEVIHKKRVSLFSPGEVVLQNVEEWLKIASTEGEYVGKTVFVDKEGNLIPAKIRITPTYANGKENGQTGFCGVTEPIDEEVKVPIKFSTKLIRALVITRLPFITASALPVVIAGVLAANAPAYGLEGAFSWPYFLLTLLGVILLHLGSNVMNDYYDYISGTDDANTGYFQKYSGGSRSIELRLITPEGTKRLGLALLGVALLIGLYLTWQVGPGVLYIGLAGLALGFFYTAPPLRLVARRGLGELVIFLTYGPLLTFGTWYVLTGQYSLEAALIGIPAGLLTTNILLINEFPDMEGDAATGKNHLVVTFGKEKSINLYTGILVLAILSTVGLSYYFNNYLLLVPAAYLTFFGWKVVQYIRQKYNTRELVKANVNTINMQLLFSVLFALGLWLNTFL